MKKILLSCAILIMFSGLAISQNVVPNEGFEDWTVTSYDEPTNYFTNNSDFIDAGQSLGIAKVSGYTGFAMQLTTSSESFSMAGNFQPQGPPPWNGGSPYTQQPTGMSGYYKSDIQAGDSATILINFSKNGVYLDDVVYKISGTQSTFTAFSFPITLTATPDSVIVLVLSSDALNDTAIVGSTVTLDDIQFTGVTSQPTFLNGDFENWTSKNHLSLDDWWIDNDREGSFDRSTDSYANTYAIELTTIEGNSNNTPVARSQGLSTSYWDDDCDCNIGGFPIYDQIDTIGFWYKYTPENNDTAEFSISFKKNGSNVGWYHERLTEATTYTHVEIPLDLSLDPADSANIQFNSSIWGDTALAYVGSTLLIDKIVFYSAPTAGLNSFKKEINKVYPNPVTEILFIDGIKTASDVTIYNILGAIVDVKTYNQGMDVSSLKNGIYFVEFDLANGENKTVKIIKK